MKIGILDIDCHASKKKWGAPVYCYAQPYRDPDKPYNIIPEWQLDMARWVNKRMIYCTIDFKDYMPRKGFKCSEYFK